MTSRHRRRFRCRMPRSFSTSTARWWRSRSSRSWSRSPMHCASLLRAPGRGQPTAPLALVSGRSIDQLDRLFEPLPFSASGPPTGWSGGCCREDVARAEDGKGGPECGDGRNSNASHENHPGTLFEDKGLTLALPYRMAAEHGETAAALVRGSGSGPILQSLVLLEGKMVFELKPPGFDKGRAIADFMEQPPFKGRRPIFAGDDVTDEAGFTVINDHDGRCRQGRRRRSAN